MSREIYVIVEQNYIHPTPKNTLRNSLSETMSIFLSVTLKIFALADSASAAVPHPEIESKYLQPFPMFSRTNLSFTFNRTIRT